MGGRAILFAYLVVFCAGASAECACVWEGSFADVQADTDLVVSGTVTSTKGNSIDVSIDQSLRGDKRADTIRVWLKARDYCRPDVAEFPVGSQWVLALHKIQEVAPGGFKPGTPNISFGRVGDYSLSNCGGFWLAQTETVVTGALINAARWDRNPKMTPVHIDLLTAFVRNEIERDTLAEASREDPALRDLMLDTKAFLRQ